MNIIEAIRKWDEPRSETDSEFIESCDGIAELLFQFDALAPDWTQAPKWAQWYAISSGPEGDSEATWHSSEPQAYSLGWTSRGEMDTVGLVNLPLGLDWRLCKWQRPEAAG